MENNQVRVAIVGVGNCAIGGALTGPSSYFMKSPPKQFTDDHARELAEAFIRNADGVQLNTAKSNGKGTSSKRRSRRVKLSSAPPVLAAADDRS